MVSNSELYRVSVAIQGVLALSPWIEGSPYFTRFDARGATVVSVGKKWGDSPDHIGWCFYAGGMISDLQSCEVLDPTDAGRMSLFEKVDAQLRAKGYLLSDE